MINIKNDIVEIVSKMPIINGTYSIVNGIESIIDDFKEIRRNLIPNILSSH